MNDARVKALPDEGLYFVFEVVQSDNTFKVKCTGEYYQKLTRGRSTPAELIKESFKFLTEHEDVASIQREFELPAIEQYFPGYEAAMVARFSSSIGK